MNFWSWLSGGASDLVNSIGTIVDDLVTSDEEKKELKIKLLKEVNSFKLLVLEKQNDYEKELTQRQSNDMKSDSWLSKNVRPLALIFLTVATVGLAYMTSFMEATDILTEWIDLLKVLLLTVYGFYFSSRAIEKITKMKVK